MTRRMGLILLKISGWDIPEDVMKRVCEPIVIGSYFTIPSNSDPKQYSAFVLEEIKNRIADSITSSAKKHIYYEIKELNSGEKLITGALIVQIE